MKRLIAMLLLLGMLLTQTTGVQLFAADEKDGDNVEQSMRRYFPQEVLEEGGSGDSHFFAELVNMFATLGLLIAVLLGGTWVLKRMTNSRLQQLNVTSMIKILEQRNLSPKTVLYLVDVGGKGVMIADNGTHIATVAEVDLEEGEAPRAVESKFEQTMKP
ncbi:MAG: flagellar biosynthetic protein FliO [Chlamydiales bacterium]|nr:flagellar biosynthetic protein FliO [Chlamydiia bacterium]MCP5508198.1 flagellar biosynthetic protein FliO [Chlamydiales bacterium]